MSDSDAQSPCPARTWNSGEMSSVPSPAEDRTDPHERFDAVIVGGGPRGVATLIRVAARLDAEAQQGAAQGPASQETVEGHSPAVPGPPDPTAPGSTGGAPLRIAIIDAVEVGPGATWTTTQPAAYLNNTTASATTIYPDESTELSGPPSPGPSLVDWMSDVAVAGTHPVGEWVAAEAQALRALDFTSRRLQGVYYRDQLDAAAAHPGIELTEVRAIAVDLERGAANDRDGAVTVVLDDGDRLRAPTVVLAQGMIQAHPDAEVAGLLDFARDHGLRYVRPGMPAERDFSGLRAGETALVRGLGANFFDVIGGLLDEWGGSFEAVPDDPHGRLRYLPSGREPHLVVGSRRGLPYRSKPIPYAAPRAFRPRWATPTWFAELSTRHDLDFAAEVWPTIAREIADQYLTALLEWAPGALRPDLLPASGAAGAGAGRTAAEPAWTPLLESAETGEDVDEVLRASVVDRRWNWAIADLRRPTRGESIGTEQWASLVDLHIADELGSMSEPARHPRAAVNRVMSVLRNSAQHLGAIGAVSGTSLVRDLHGWFDTDGLYLASGPPSGRVRRVLALIDAGVIDLLGPETTIETELGPDPCFRATSAITGRTAESTILLETRMSKGKAISTDDPLLQALLSSGRARIHAVDEVRTDYIEATGAKVDEAVTRGHNLVGAAGDVDESVVVLGIPASTTQPGSAIGATPHVPSPLLAGADIAAKQIARRRIGQWRLGR